MQQATTKRTAVYRLFGEDGLLLYVGMAGDPERRWQDHARNKPWWGDVARKTTEWHPDRMSAQVAEADAIKAESPLHNLVAPDPSDPFHWPPSDWAEIQVEGSRRWRENAVSAERCSTCGALGPPPVKMCAADGCGATFRRSEGGRTDAIYCSRRCARAQAVRAYRRRQREEQR